MYTVILQSRSAVKSYESFHPLFTHTLSGGEVKICSWIEDATTLETALPELYEMVGHKKQWRAIIVQADMEDNKTRYETINNNPYDFELYQKKEFHAVNGKGEISLSEIPLVRITQLLGGIPATTFEFESTRNETDDENFKRSMESDSEQYDDENWEETGNIPGFRLAPENTNVDKEQRIIDNWNENRLVRIAPPSEILLVRTRRASLSTRNHEMDSVWNKYHESDASSFWIRNGYAPNCRFMVFDVDMHGILRKQGDMFRLWLSVMLLADNEISSSILQATKLYKLDVELNELKLTDNIQQTVNQLNYVHYEIEHRIRSTEKEFVFDEDNAPENINQSISVQMSSAGSSDFLLNVSEFHTVPEKNRDDEQLWKDYTTNSRKTWEKTKRITGRKLEQAANELHKKIYITTDEIHPLTEYQREDLTFDLDEFYTGILNDQECLPANEYELQEKLEEKENAVNKEMRKRTDKRTMRLSVVLSLFFVLASLSYAFFTNENKAYVGILVALLVLLVLISGWFVMAMQFSRFARAIKEYQKVYFDALYTLSSSSEIFSSFFSKIASRIRGKRYLYLMDMKKKQQTERHNTIDKQRRSVVHFHNLLGHWREALQLDVDMNNEEATKSLADIKPSLDVESLYALKTSFNTTVEINKTGYFISTPYDFVEKVNIEREEVFDRG